MRGLFGDAANRHHFQSSARVTGNDTGGKRPFFLRPTMRIRFSDPVGVPPTSTNPRIGEQREVANVGIDSRWSTNPGTSKTRTNMPSPSFFDCRFSPASRTTNDSPARLTDDTGSPPPAILVVGLNITRNINGVLMHTRPPIGMPFARCGRQLTTGASNLGSRPATLTEPRAIRQSNQST